MRDPSCFKDVLLEKVLMVQPPPRLCLRTGLPLGPIVKSFPCHGCPRSSAACWCGVSGARECLAQAGVLNELVVGNPGAARIDFPLPPV